MIPEKGLKPKRRGLLEGILDWVERVGNKLPHPFILFVYITVILMLISYLLASTGVSAIHPGNGETVTVKNLLTREGVSWKLENALKNLIVENWIRSYRCWIG